MPPIQAAAMLGAPPWRVFLAVTLLLTVRAMVLAMSA